MNRTDVKTAMTAIADELIDTDEGAHWLRVVKEFENQYADELDTLTAELRDDYLRLRAKEVVADRGRRNNAQLKLPGLDEIDATVTCRDGEGGYRHKSIYRATDAELIEDAQIHDENVAAAIGARDRARLRNKALLPVMAEHGFVTAGEAIDYLNEQAGA